MPVFKPSYLIHKIVHRIVRENLLRSDQMMETPHDSAIVKRSVRIAGHATSISLEAAFWRALCAIAAARRMSVSALVAAIDAGRGGNLSSAIRLFVLDSARRGELTEPAESASLSRPQDGD
jgi:predicted DNA-binding ribbon-helix-helix protein